MEFFYFRLSVLNCKMALSGNEKFDVKKESSSGSSPYSKMTKKELSQKFMLYRLKVNIRRGYRCKGCGNI